MNFCPKCGEKVEPDDKFCISCGQSLENISNNNQPLKKKSHKKWWLIFIIIVVVILILCFFLFNSKELEYSSESHPSTEQVDESSEESSFEETNSKITEGEFQSDSELTKAVLIVYGRHNIDSKEWENVEDECIDEAPVEGSFVTSTETVDSGFEYQFATSVVKDSPKDIVGIPTAVVDDNDVYFGTISQANYLEDSVSVKDIVKDINDNYLEEVRKLRAQM